MNAKEIAIAEYNKEIERLQKIRDAVVSLPDGLDDLFPGGMFLPSGQNIRFDVPYTANVFADFRKILGRDWQRKGNEWTSDDGDKYFSFRHKQNGISLLLCLRPDFKGATCERKQVGVKAIPVYKVVCG